MPGSEAPNTPVPGLASVVVDLKTGYGYDVDIDVPAFGANPLPESSRQQYTILLFVSADNGATWTSYLAEDVYAYDFVAAGRLHVLIPSAPADWNMVRVVCRSAAGVAASLVYPPGATVLRIQEYSVSP
jgi:hypothetical protein